MGHQKSPQGTAKQQALANTNSAYVGSNTLYPPTASVAERPTDTVSWALNSRCCKKALDVKEQ